VTRAPRSRFLAAAALVSVISAREAKAQDLSAVVAKAREQVDTGNYQEAVKILGTLRGKNLPPQLAVEAALLETTALIVVSTPQWAAAACARAIKAGGFDPEVARDQSPKIREVCRAAAKKARAERLAAEGATLGELEVKAPEVAYQPVRVATTVEKRPAWLKVVARVESSDLEGTFDVPLIPSKDGPLLGTLDPSWIRPKSKLTVRLVAQDKFGDLADPAETVSLDVPAAEALIALGKVPSGATVTLDGRRAKPDPSGRVAAPAGKHEVALTLEDGARAEATVELRRGAITRVALSPQRSEPSRVLPWVATGTSLALLVAGGVLLINAEARRVELEDAAKEREPGTDLPATDFATLEEIDEERQVFQNVGIGLMAGGGGVAVLAVVFWTVPIGGSSSTASVRPLIGPGTIGVAGSF
jgi:hypothetical protein